MNTQELNAAVEIAKKILVYSGGYTEDSVAVARAFLAIYEATRWRPIENSPRDGTPFIAFRDLTELGKKMNKGTIRSQNGLFMVSRIVHGQLRCWTSKVLPTHWKPLDTPEE